MHRAFAAFLFAALVAGSPSAMALGFGAVHNPTRLGQPLEFSVAVRLDDGETLEPECVTAEVSSGDQRLLASDVHARLLKGSSDRDMRISVVTSVRLREPVMTLQISAGCATRVVRRFVNLLDPAPLRPPAVVASDVAAPASAPLTTTADTAAPEAPSESWPALPPEVAARRQVEALEAQVEQLERELRAARQLQAEVQAQLRQAQERPAAVLALVSAVALVIVLLGVTAVVLWRRARGRGEQSWRRSSQALSGRSSMHGSDAETGTGSAAIPAMGETTVTSMRVVRDTSGYGAVAWSEPPTPRELNPTATVPLSARMRRELTAEELIDLEQQADFFIALGQEDAAIDLLMGHVRHSGGTSPIPYLKLLQIYRRRGADEAYERIRERFNRRFNAQAPQWDSDAAQGRGLESYPDVVPRLQSAWKVPAQANELLQALLFRRDASQEQFDLPAYEELLFLYALARDLAEQQSRRDGVDLLLPLDLGEAPPAIVRAEVTRMPAARAGLDVDLDVPGPAPQSL